MNTTTRDRCILNAQNAIATRNPVTEQQVLMLKIWDKLQDGEWHTSGELAEAVERSPRYMERQLMPILKEAWGLASGRQGYCLPSEKPIIV